MPVQPAARQMFAGEEQHVGLAEPGRVLHFLAGVKSSLEIGPEGIEQGFEVHHLNNIAAGFMLQKHGASAFHIPPPGSGIFATPDRGKTILAPPATGLIALPYIGRGETVEIAFLDLDRLDQFGFVGFSRVQSLLAGNLAYSLDFHDFASLRNVRSSKDTPARLTKS
jgi:hypothetical protein